MEEQIVKVLTGSQAGAEVFLASGEYSIGSGIDDDLQFVDLSLSEGHARLRLSPDKIEIASNNGKVFLADSSVLEGKEAGWQEVAALDVITIGTTSFAVGSLNAAWGTLVNHQGVVASSNPTQQAAKENSDKSNKTTKKKSGLNLSFTALSIVSFWHLRVLPFYGASLALRTHKLLKQKANLMLFKRH